MTGFGEAHCQQDGLAVAVEVRTINSRFFKLVIRCAEGYSALEPEIEQIVREQIKRGTLQINLRVDRPHSPDEFRVNVAVLEGYRKQLEEVRTRWQLPAPIALEPMLQLPGVIDESGSKVQNAADDWPLIAQTLKAALANLSHMRQDEGRAMATDLKSNVLQIASQLTEVEKRAPAVLDAYRVRLEERLRTFMTEHAVDFQTSDLIREIGIHADRGDISEEIVRLKSHLEQFDAFMALAESSGRKLEFLTQEMFREVNTIGSKSNDVTIARHVIEMKAAIEKIREMIQNVE